MATLPELFKETGDVIAKIEHRPFDRFILGPFLIWYGLRSKSMSRWPRRAIIAGGIYQILYAYKEYRALYGAVTASPKATLEVFTNKDPGVFTNKDPGVLDI